MGRRDRQGGADGAGEPVGGGGRSLLASRPLQVAGAVTALGAGMWGYAAATRPEAPASGSVSGLVTTEGGGSRASDLVSGFAPMGGGATARPEGAGGGSAAGNEDPAARVKRLIDEASPATFRLGLSFIVGFFVAWLFRKFLKVSLLVAGGIATVLIVLKATGVVSGFDWSGVERQVDQGQEWVRENANTFREFVLGYVPSGAAAAVGAFFGIRR